MHSFYFRLSFQLLLYEATGKHMYAEDIEGFLKGWQPGGFVQYTPCGLAWSEQTYWGSNRHAGENAITHAV